MKKRSLLIGLFLIISISIGIIAGQQTDVCAATKLKTTNLTLWTGQKKTISLKKKYKKVKWSTSKSSVAKVSKKGRVTAKSAGSANIYAKIGKKKYKCKIKVKNYINCSYIKLDVRTIYFNLKLANSSGVSWSSSNKSVAVVRNNGQVIALKEGTCKIYGKTKTKTYSCTVVVTNLNDLVKIDEQSCTYDLYRLVNNERLSRRVAPLKFLSKLNQAASIRAVECSTKFSSYRPDGTECFTVYAQVGLKKWWRRAENIAMGYTSADNAFKSWMSSSEHKNHIISSEYVYTGISYKIINDQCYWVQEFYDD